MKIIDAFNNSRNRHLDLKKMFDAIGEDTCACIAAGCVTLATLWANAWEEGGGDNLDDSKLVAINTVILKDLYNDFNFLPSYLLTNPALKDSLR